MARMTNLERALRPLLVRAHRSQVSKRHCYKEGGLTLMVNPLSRLDPLTPIRVNSAGQAKLPPKPLIATLLLDRLKDERLSYFSIGYSVERGRIKHVRLYDRLPPEDDFWWLTVVTALNLAATDTVEASRSAQMKPRSRASRQSDVRAGAAIPNPVVLDDRTGAQRKATLSDEGLEQLNQRIGRWPSISAKAKIVVGPVQPLAAEGATRGSQAEPFKVAVDVHTGP